MASVTMPSAATVNPTVVVMAAVFQMVLALAAVARMAGVANSCAITLLAVTMDNVASMAPVSHMEVATLVPAAPGILASSVIMPRAVMHCLARTVVLVSRTVELSPAVAPPATARTRAARPPDATLRRAGIKVTVMQPAQPICVTAMANGLV
jgi:hypothetical protein